MKYLVEVGYCSGQYEDTQYHILRREVVEADSYLDAESTAKELQSLIDLHTQHITDEYIFNHSFIHVHEWMYKSNEQVIQDLIESLYGTDVLTYMKAVGLLTPEFLNGETLKV